MTGVDDADADDDAETDMNDETTPIETSRRSSLAIEASHRPALTAEKARGPASGDQENLEHVNHHGVTDEAAQDENTFGLIEHRDGGMIYHGPISRHIVEENGLLDAGNAMLDQDSHHEATGEVVLDESTLDIIEHRGVAIIYHGRIPWNMCEDIVPEDASMVELDPETSAEMATWIRAGIIDRADEAKMQANYETQANSEMGTESEDLIIIE
jgi:hypothetical protein